LRDGGNEVDVEVSVYLASGCHGRTGLNRRFELMKTTKFSQKAQTVVEGVESCGEFEE
jgi:hypothetical protein